MALVSREEDYGLHKYRPCFLLFDRLKNDLRPVCVSLNWLVKLCLNLDVWEEHKFLSKYFQPISNVEMYMYLGVFQFSY